MQKTDFTDTDTAKHGMGHMEVEDSVLPIA
jgi:hypothetical protein